MENPRVLTWSAVSSKKQAADDKFSIPDQIAMGRAVCARLGGTLVDELVVGGFSRDYRTLAKVVAATDDNDMDAFRKLHHYIETKAFDVFVCLDADRFGRKASLLLEIIDLITNEMKADLITYIDNVTMDDENSLTVGLLKAYKAQMDVRRMTENYRKGMNVRAGDGRSTSSTLPPYHLRVRDDKGKEIKIIVNEDMRQVWTDVAALILERVGWDMMEQELFDRFGHGKNGGRYPTGTLYSWVLNPGFWGHTGRNWKKHGNRFTKRGGPWIWDSTLPAPDDVQMHRDVKPAVYSGEWTELGERVKAELLRRYRRAGKASVRNTFRYHGLLVCEECGYTMNKANGKLPHQVYVGCQTKSRQDSRPVNCTQTRYIRADEVQDYCDRQLKREVAGEPNDLFEVQHSAASIEKQIAGTQRSRDKNTNRVQSLVQELADAPSSVRDVYRQQIAAYSLDIERDDARLVQLQRALGGQRHLQSDQARVIADLRERGVDWLWQQPDGVIHQYLSAALGDSQLVVKDGEIIGTAPARPKVVTLRRKRSG